MNRPTDEAMLTKQLSKLGDTVFSFGRLTADIDEGLIVPAGKLNELRRQVTEKLTELVTQKYTPKYTVTDYFPAVPAAHTVQSAERLPVRTFCRTAEQIKAAADTSEFLIIPEELLTDDILGTVDRDKIIVSPPRYITDEDSLTSRLEELISKGVGRLYCHTPDSVAIGKKLGMKLHGSFTLNVFNSFSADYLHGLGLEDCVFSVEATLGQLGSVSTALPLGAVIYGRLPLMLTRNCPIKNKKTCAQCGRGSSLTDRKGITFPVVCSSGFSEILNSKPVYMADRLDEIKNAGFIMLYFTTETKQEAAEIIGAYRSGKSPSGEFTRGFLYRGVE
jgi:putative protease